MNIENPLFERSLLVFDRLGLERLADSHVLVAGVGGVGGFVAEALARAGVGTITLVDHDSVAGSNKNRQIVALDSTVGLNKAVIMAKRIKDIHSDCQVNVIQDFLRPETMDTFLDGGFDFVIDAIDSLNCKVSLVTTAFRKGIPVASSMGAGRRVDPSKIQLADFSKTHGCALARNMRQRLRKQGIKKGIMTVFSSEEPKGTGPYQAIEGARGRVVNGTASYMPGIFGLMLAGYVINSIAEAERKS